MSVKLIDNHGHKLDLQWNDNFRSSFHAIWLRDNCRCDQCGEPAIGRRTLKLSELDIDLKILNADLTETGDQASINLTWSDGHNGTFSTSWLRQYCYDTPSRSTRSFSPILWSDEFRVNPPNFEYDEIATNDKNFFDLLLALRNHGLCFINNASEIPGTLESLASKIGWIQENNFGRVQDLVVDDNQRSIANDVEPLKPHTDEPYRASPPGIILFHCIETDTAGAGSSTFLDGFEAADALRNEDPDGFAALTNNRQLFRRHFDGDVDLIAEFPVISTDEFKNICGVRVNDRVAAPACIHPDQVPVYYRGMKRFLELVEDNQRILNKKLNPGDIVIFDNHRILHGRTRLTMNARRWLQWVQLERGDFHSRLRILSDQLNIPRDALPLLRGAYG